MWTKYFYYFQGLRAIKCHQTKRSNRVNYQLKPPLQKTSLSSTPPSHLDFQGLSPPLPREFPEFHPSGGCGFFLEQPNASQPCILLISSCIQFLSRSRYKTNNTYWKTAWATNKSASPGNPLVVALSISIVAHWCPSDVNKKWYWESLKFFSETKQEKETFNVVILR